jgi:enterochelin esterase-like enzyme
MKRSIQLFVVATMAFVAVAAAQNPAPAFLQVRAVPHGTVQSYPYKSKALGTDRRMVVYTPPDYEKSTGRYPVLYLLQHHSRQSPG